MTPDALSSHIVRILLRYFRKGAAVNAGNGKVQVSDRDLLILQWAISDKVRDLCTYLSQHPHELRAALQPRVASGQAIRGSLLASRTVVEQTLKGDPSAFVYVEPFRSYDTGANRVLGWTLSYALALSRRFRDLVKTDESSYFRRALEALRAIESVRPLLPAAVSIPTPTAGDVRSARASRSVVYRKAAEALDYLRAIERLDEQALEHVLSGSLVGPMERWRQFELSLALAMAEALSKRIGSEIEIKNIYASSLDSIFEIGDYAVRWQKAGPRYQAPTLDGWEKTTEDIIVGYGISPGYDRPDVVVFNRKTNEVLAVGEAKYFESDSWKDRLRDAVGQVVMYSRGYEQTQDVKELIGRSLIALWSAEPVVASEGSPCVVTFDQMTSGLETWAARAIA